MTSAAILALLLSLPPYHADRDMPREARQAMLAPVAEAIEAHGGNKFGVAALITVGWHESRFARYVLEGRCLDGPEGQQCDKDPRTGLPRARGPFQVWDRYCPEVQKLERGTPASLSAEAHCASRRLRGAYSRCRSRHASGDIAGMFAGYRSVDCTWRPAEERMRTHHKMLWLLSKP